MAKHTAREIQTRDSTANGKHTTRETQQEIQKLSELLLLDGLAEYTNNS